MGLEWAGMSTKAMCEKDPYCRKVLAKHWPDLTIHEDIRDLDGKEYANSIDVVAGGFPCQPFSQAGKRKGKLDIDRHLWPEMFRVIKESRPRWVIGENVFGFINMALDDVQSDLESEQYEVRKFVLPAVAVDAKHRRDRCFVIAYSNSDLIRNKPRWGDGENGQGSPISTDHGEAQSMANSNSHDGWRRSCSKSQGRESRMEHGGRSSRLTERQSGQALAYTNGERQLQQRGTEQEVGGWSGNSSEQVEEDVANTIYERSQRGLHRGKDTQRESELGHSGRSSSTHGQPRQEVWLPEPRVGRVAHGVPNRVDRLKGLGNAVVPQLIQAIGEIVIKADREIYS